MKGTITVSETSEHKFANRNIQTADTLIHGSGSRVEDETDKKDVVDQAIADTNAEQTDTTTAPNTTHGMSRGAKVALAGGGVLLVGGLAAGGVAAANGVFNPSTAQGGQGSGEGTTGNGGDIVGNTITIELSPEQLAQLSPEQLSNLFTIQAVGEDGQPTTVGEATEAFEHNLEGILNSGSTEGDYAPYENTPRGEFEGAMQGKYDAPALGAMFYDPAQAQWVSVNHSTNLTLSYGAHWLELDDDFAQSVEITPESGIDLEAPADSIQIPITLEFLSNAEELGLIDFFHDTVSQIDNIDRTETAMLTFTNVDGQLKATVTRS